MMDNRWKVDESGRKVGDERDKEIHTHRERASNYGNEEILPP